MKVVLPVETMRLNRAVCLVINVLVLLTVAASGSSTAAIASVSTSSSCTRRSAASDRRSLLCTRTGGRREFTSPRESEGTVSRAELAWVASSCRGGASVERQVAPGEPRTIQSRLRRPVKICTLFLVSYMCSILFNLNNKRALLLVPLPWTYAALNLAMGGGIGLVSWGTRAVPWPKINLADVWELTLMAFLHAVAHITFVLGLGRGGVSFLQTVKAAEACFTSLLSFLVQGQVLPLPVYLSLLPVVLGVGITSFNQPRFSWVALVAALLSNLTTALRNVLIVHKIGPAAARSASQRTSGRLQTHQPGAHRLARLIGGGTGQSISRRAQVPEGGLVTLAPGDTFRLITLIGAVLIVPVAAIFEGKSWPRLWRGALDLFFARAGGRGHEGGGLGDVSTAAVSAARGDWAQAVRHALVSGVTFNIFYMLCFRLLGQLHPVTHAVGNTFKRVFVIGAGAVAFGGDMGGAKGILGTVMAVAGVLGYSLARAACEPRPDAPRKC